MSTMGDIGRQLLEIALGSACAFWANCATAQIKPDRTLPNNSSVTINGSVFNITGGTQAGRNLFHSFQQFSVPTGSTAFFNNAADIQNIFGRVTGNNISNIDGLIRANGTANLFLINPSGIIFGPNASLNIGGSFVGTTANVIQFGNLGFFSATNPEAPSPLLTINPSALLFNQVATAPIQNNSVAPAGKDPVGLNAFGLRVPDGHSLLLVGGNINMDGGQLNAYGGQIELGSVLQGSVTLDPTLATNYALVENFGNIQLKNGAKIETSGIRGGEIQIQAQNLELSEGSSITSFTSGNFQGGNITVNAAETVELIGTGKFVETLQQFTNPTSNPSNLSNTLLSFGFNTGSGGNIEINTKRLSVRDGFFIIATATGVGKSGDITINTSDSVEVINSFLAAGTRPGSSGPAGNLTINTSSLMLSQGSLISTATAGSGKGGNLTINALESVELEGGIPYQLLNIPVNTNLTTDTLGAGDAGDLRITTQKLTIQDGAYVSATSASARSFNIQDGANVTVSSPQGQAGNLTVTAKDIRLNQGSVTAETAVTRGQEGANIQIQGLDFLLLQNNSSISARASGNARGGNITIDADATRGFVVAPPLQNSDIIANATFGNGGNITISARQVFGFTQGQANSSDRTNDIDASSLFSQSGTVTINTSDIDPSRGLATLPTVIPDTPRLVASSCAVFGNKFTITGRGGLPQGPDEPLTSDVVWTDTRLPVITAQHQHKIHAAKPKLQPIAIVPATGWVFNDNGVVTLISSTTNATSLNTPTGCLVK